MPRVPTYDNLTANPTNLPDARQTVPDRMMQQAAIGPGEQIKAGRQLTEAGTEVGRMAIAAQIQDNEDKAKTADTDFVAGANAILHGTQDDPSTGYITKQGGDAVDSFDATRKQLDDLKQKTLDGLGNDAQRRIVANAIEMRYQSSVTQAADHAARQKQVYTLATSQTRAQVNADAAVGAFDPTKDSPLYRYNPEDPSTSTPYQQHLHTVYVEASLQAGIQGITDPTARSDYVRKALQGVYASKVHDLLVNNNTAGAKAFFKEVKGELDTKTRDTLTQLIKPAETQDQVLQYSDKLFATVPGMQAQLKQVQADFDAGKVDGQQRVLIEARIEHKHALAKQNEGEFVASALGKAQDFFIRNPGADVTELPKPIYLALQAKGHLSSAVAMANGQNRKGDPTLYNDLLDQSVRDPAGFLRTNPDQFAGQLSPTQLQHIKDTRRGINEDSARQLESTKLAANAVQDAKQALVASGLNLNAKPGTTAAKDVEAFTANLHEALYTAAKNNGGVPLTREQAKEITLGTLRDQALSGTGFFGTSIGKEHTAVWRMTPEQRAKPFEIPDTERTKITSALAALKKPVTEENIQQLYKLGLGVR